MDGGTQGRGLAHGSVAVVLTLHENRTEQEGNGQARHQMVQRQLHARAFAKRALPGVDGRCGRVERHRVGIGVAGGADADGFQMLLVETARDPVEIQLRAQQIPQRRVVEQRVRRPYQPAAGDEGQHPVQAGLEHTQRVGLEHMVNSEVAPHALDRVHGLPEMRRIGRQCDGAHGAGGGPGDDGERAGRAAPQDLGDPFEHADLVGRPRAAAGQYQA